MQGVQTSNGKNNRGNKTDFNSYDNKHKKHVLLVYGTFNIWELVLSGTHKTVLLFQ